MPAIDPASRAAVEQKVFRVLLEALSRPGEVGRLPAPEPGPRARLQWVLQTLLDPEVGFSLAGRADAALTPGIVREWTGSALVEPAAADFLVVDGAGSGGLVRRLPRGTPEFPDRGATVIYSLPPAEATGTPQVVLAGPGVPPPGRRAVAIPGIAPQELEALREANAEFPLGLDSLFLLADGGLIGLPRSARILTVEVAAWPT